jgi:hypothetical protein
MAAMLHLDFQLCCMDTNMYYLYTTNNFVMKQDMLSNSKKLFTY